MKNMCNKIFAALFILHLFSCSEGSSIIHPIPDNPFDAQVVTEMNQENIPALSAAIVKDDSIVWIKSYGYADIAVKKATTHETIFVLASVSKTFRAVSVLQLVEEGKLNLDTDVNEYLPFSLRNPNFPDEPITVRMLLDHHSSISSPLETVAPDFYDFFVRPNSPTLTEHLESYLLPSGQNYRNGIWLGNRPGTMFQYSNLGSRVLSLIVQEVSGDRIHAFMHKRIFQPLAMDKSSFGLNQENEALLATLYDSNLNTYPHYDFPLMVRCSSRELANYLMMVINKGSYKNTRILSENTAIEMINLDYTRSDQLRNIWWDHQDGWIGHTGGYRGAACSIEFNPESKIGIIILSNLQQGSVGPGGSIHSLLRSRARDFE